MGSFPTATVESFRDCVGMRSSDDVLVTLRNTSGIFDWIDWETRETPALALDAVKKARYCNVVDVATAGTIVVDCFLRTWDTSRPLVIMRVAGWSEIN